MPTLDRLLPPDAREHRQPLEYGLGLPSPGIYLTRLANGALATVRLARDVRPPRGTIWTHDPGCHCTHVLRLEDDHRTGYFRSRTVGTSYRSDGMLVTANGWTEDDDVEPAGCDCPSWAAAQLAKMVEWAGGDAAPGREGPKRKRPQASIEAEEPAFVSRAPATPPATQPLPAPDSAASRTSWRTRG